MKRNRYVKHIKNKKPNKLYSAVLKEQLLLLSPDERKKYRKYGFCNALIAAVAFFVFFAFVALGAYLSTLFENGVEGYIFCGRACGIIVIIAGCVIGLICACLAASILLNKVSENYSVRLPEKNRPLLSRACGFLRKRYGLTEPFVLTKCYACSNENFVKQDVCLFYAKVGLCITQDIVNGFGNGYKDFGCYILTLGKYTVENVTEDGKSAVKITAGEFYITVGCRASKFVKRGLILEKGR